MQTIYRLAVATCLCLIVMHLQVIAQGRFPANAEETKLCRELAAGRNFADAYKTKRLSCDVTCRFGKNEPYEEEIVNSPDGQTCDAGIGLPTGRCQDGKCPILGNMKAV